MSNDSTIISPAFSFKGLDWLTFIKKNKLYIKLFLTAGIGLATYASIQLPSGWKEVVSTFVTAAGWLIINGFDAWISQIEAE